MMRKHKSQFLSRLRGGERFDVDDFKRCNFLSCLRGGELNCTISFLLIQFLSRLRSGERTAMGMHRIF